MSCSAAFVRDISNAKDTEKIQCRTVKLHLGEEIILQEATVANLVRAYLGIKTHSKGRSYRLIGRELTEA